MTRLLPSASGIMYIGILIPIFRASFRVWWMIFE